MSKINVEIVTDPLYSALPEYKSEQAAGCDLVSAGEVSIPSGWTSKIPTVIKIAMPPGHFALIKERSSLGAKGVIAVGGIIDSDYRGEIFVTLHNLGNEFFFCSKGTRLANLIFIPYVRAKFIEVTQLEQTARGEGGFGSTGG